jgi:putative Holliday junction resolvase
MCRGLRVYLQDEYGTTIDALEFMISRGVKRSARDVKSDAYSAMVFLCFGMLLQTSLLVAVST